MSCIELLHRQGLYRAANDLILRSDDPSIRAYNMLGTSMYVSCAKCKHAAGPGYRCVKCTSILSLCSLCQTPVHGLYTWCISCGHGGHLVHMQEWFSYQEVCPEPGCLHKCNLLVPSAKSTNEAQGPSLDY
ncbi:unnamed protein product [Discosporangium mesarthrocarpum]